jgi:hypothetical protein
VERWQAVGRRHPVVTARRRQGRLHTVP